ncbi:hypothetical protein M3147_19045, partial [Agromyces mediolanus]|nr:hypothetical protein [Agromyces mediolanus]
MLIADDERWDRVADLRADYPGVTRILISRAAQPLEGAERLEDIIGTPHDWAALPAGDLPDAGLVPEDEATILYT